MAAQLEDVIDANNGPSKSIRMIPFTFLCEKRISLLNNWHSIDSWRHSIVQALFERAFHVYYKIIWQLKMSWMNTTHGEWIAFQFYWKQMNIRWVTLVTLNWMNLKGETNEALTAAAEQNWILNRYTQRHLHQNRQTFVVASQWTEQMLSFQTLFRAFPPKRIQT